MSKFQRFLAGFAVLAIVSAITIGGWAYLNRPVEEVPWPKTVQGFALSPYQEGEDAIQSQLPSEEEIRSDLRLLAGKTHALRTYSTQGSLAEIARIAAEFNLNVAQGAWISRDAMRNEEEIRKTIELVHQHHNIVRVVVGNEALLRNEVSPEDLMQMLDHVRANVKRPVSTAEPWHVWLAHPELAKHVDYICVHMLPFWEGVAVGNAVDYIVDKMKKLEERFPDKKIVIGEVGWPSEGRTREGAVANVTNEALFLRRFIHRAEQEGYIYYVMEAFDQPWKAQLGGAVEAYWGVYDVNRRQKFVFTEPVVRMPGWHLLAGISVALAALLLGAFYLYSDTLKTRGRFFLALVVYATATAAVYIIYDYSQQYVTLTTILVGAFLGLGMLGVIAVLLAEAHEWAEAHWVTKRLRMLTPSETANHFPKVSIHVPAYNEPPDMLIATINALAQLDYPDFEVLVIDNNTKDEAVWRPVEAHCATLGPRFRFFHVAPLAGFKAGALNFALRQTDPAAEVVACIDADYQVTPDWLRDLVPPFANPRMAIVQAPQDYRDEEENAFKAMCYAEYRGFFHIGMITRNERNAIIQHGTMTMVRRDLLERLGGWSEWCITEDAELGLRVFEAGYEATYIPDSYGRGLMPDTFIDFKKQRYRWAYGAMQIMRRHMSAIWNPGSSALTPGQRYHFAAGWLPWIADGFNLSFNLAALCWSAAMVYAPSKVDPPLMLFSFLPLALFTFKLAKLVHLYTTRVGANLRQTFAAALAGLALSHTIGIAVMKGLFTSNEPFFRTPKQAQPHALFKALASAREETLLMVTLWLAAWGIERIPQEIGSPDLNMWVAVLLIQSIPYAASLIVSLVSAFPIPAAVLGVTPDGYRTNQPGIASRARVAAPGGRPPTSPPVSG
jgi:exo-beta-1,3-glucanase (GH17 family)/cellulose synthase/poly-beta-1,6-N-acetylglucosamine synthase-like glycosyltransferase